MWIFGEVDLLFWVSIGKKRWEEDFGDLDMEGWKLVDLGVLAMFKGQGGGNWRNCLSVVDSFSQPPVDPVHSCRRLWVVGRW